MTDTAMGSPASREVAAPVPPAAPGSGPAASTAAGSAGSADAVANGFAPGPGGRAAGDPIPGAAGMPAPVPSLWRHRPFAVLWLARVVSVAGGMASMIAIQWWVLDTTGSAQWMATVNAVATLVMALVGIPAGVLVDRWHRGRFFLVLEAGRGAVMAALAALLFSGHATFPVVLVLLAVDAAGLALFMPLSSAIWPELVPPQQLAAANGLVATGESTGRILGPAIGGLLASRHPGWAILANAVSYACSAAAVVAAGALGWKAPRGRVPDPGDRTATEGAAGVGDPAGRRSPSREQDGTAVPGGPGDSAGDGSTAGERIPATARGGSFVAQFREGWAAVFGRPDLGPFFLLVSVLNLVFSASFVLIPVVVREVLRGGPEALGWLQAAFAVGAVTGGLLAGSGRVPRRSRSWVLLVLFQAGLAVIVGASRWLATSILAGWAFGLINTLVNVAVTTMLQEAVAPALRGRVFGLLFTVAMILQPLGQMTGGMLADRVPVPSIFTATALSTVMVMAVAWWRAPAMRALLDRPHRDAGRRPPAPAGEVSTG
ncbi:major facilitator superfamily MFS_1 [Thermaerobacter marianensis DSM 12885]|uniref:Major facilitator superfamily MFS_1 n=1 Tax=Thermaerobacter marianensis (strain ATCC 700841 / DSM 12885 / JCM 10246 / 7p75a) TaxID=644966 RepID=E6SMR5_THEM7|nr:MFS transporter [Thermaerobacter marianensis]ADU51557.1 major facilitator superfamily MFS_1 [Thermaerobacter marianensis DSM 12885]